jgi:probable phosphoglycerate mutase
VDVELSEEGRLQAELLRDRMKNYPIDALYSSNLIRAVQTAQIINEELKLPHEISG